MKRKGLLLLGASTLLMLSSCGGTNVPPIDENKKLELTDDMFTELGKQYHLENIVHEKINTVSKYYINESLHNSNEYTYIQYKSFDTEKETTKDDRVLFETYSKEKESGNLLTSRLDVSNKVNYYKVRMPDGSAYMNWDTLGYGNMFTGLKASYFSKFAEGTYTLDVDNNEVKPLATRIATQLYGNGGFSIKGLSLYIDKTGITSFNTIFTEYVSLSGNTTYQYNIDTTIVEKGDATKFVRRAEPKKEVTDKVFTDTIASLKEHNFTMKQTNYVGGAETFVYSMKVNKDKIYTIKENKEDETIVHEALYKKGTEYFNASLIGGSLYQNGQIEEKIFGAHFPTFNMARSSFKKETDGSYTFLRDEFEGDFDIATQFENDTTVLKNLTISIEENKVTFTNTYKDWKTVVEYTDIKKTDTGFTQDSVKVYDANKATWTDLVSSENLAILTSIFGTELSANLPIPSNMRKLDSWIIQDISEDPSSHIYLLAYQDTSVDKVEATEGDVLVYEESLKTAGYTLYHESQLTERCYSKKVGDKLALVEVIFDSGTFILYISSISGS